VVRYQVKSDRNASLTAVVVVFEGALGGLSSINVVRIRRRV
jgi:hypothetical protein